MPLKRDETGAVVGARCINGCADLEELDEPTAMLVVRGPAEPPADGEAPLAGARAQRVTVLFCPDCQYMELYYGA